MAKRTKKETVLTLEEKLQQELVPVEEQPYPVPANWCWVRHNTILDISGGSQPAKSLFISEPRDGYIQLYQTRDYGEHPVPVYIPIEYATKTTNEGDILLARYGGSLGKVFRAHNGAYNVALAKVTKLIPATLNDEFLFLYYQSHFYQDFCVHAASGRSAQAGFNRNDMDNLLFPLPPLPEQQRIVARIESLFAKLDEVKEKAQAVVDGYEGRKAAILHKAFTGELTVKWRKENGITDSWKQKNFVDVTINLDHKRIPLSKTERASLARIYDYYGASGIIDKVDRFIFEGKYLLIGEDGANLVMRSKPIAFIAEGKFWVNNHAHILDVKSEILLEFLCFYINSIDLIPYVTGSAQPKMTQAKMNTIPVPVPTIHEQKELIRIITNIINAEEKVKEVAESVLDQIDTMKKSILARAFRGELGTNDPSDEPAIELLKRVLQEE